MGKQYGWVVWWARIDSKEEDAFAFAFAFATDGVFVW